MAAADPITAVTNLVGNVIDRVFGQTPEQASQAKLQVMQMVQSGDIAQMAEQAGIVQAEAQSSNWLTSSWRPITMLVFVAIIANNYLLFPYLQLFFHTGLMLSLPPDMWDLLKLGLGGYVMGRSIEKAVSSWKAGS